MYLPHRIDAETRGYLEHSDPDALAEMERANTRYLDTIYPKPSETEMLQAITDMETEWNRFHDTVRNMRMDRYLERPLPKKLQNRFEYSERVFSRLIHNEIMRVTGMITRNKPRATQPQSGPSAEDLERAQKQQRWQQELLGAMERQLQRPLWRKLADHAAGDGMGYLFFFLTDAYDHIDFEVQPDEENNWQRYHARIDREVQQAGLPFGMRWIDPLSAGHREGEGGPYMAYIAEMKPRRKVYESLLKRKGQDEFDKLALPRIGSPGAPQYSQGTGERDLRVDEAECKMYYDERWYAYFVDGVLVEGPVEHGLPGVPLIPFEGMTTGSSERSQEFQGITWGLGPSQTALDVVLSQELDVAITYGRPHPIVETPAGANVLMQGGKPEVLDLSQPGLRQLLPGQRVTDALKDFKPKDTAHIQEMLLMIWQRSGLNPIAQGESPGADPAGYTVNTLQGAAQSNYEILLDNMARGWGRACDFARLTIRDTIQEKVWLSAPMGGGRTEWMALGPADIDANPVVIYIDPLSDANRMSRIQLFAQLNKEGIIPRRLVQQAAPGGEDSEAWDNEIVMDEAEKRMFEQLVNDAMEQVRLIQQAEQAGPEQGPEAEAAQLTPDMGAPRAPTVGAGQAESSQNGRPPGESSPGPPFLNSRRMSAGQGAGYQPAPGQMTETEGEG